MHSSTDPTLSERLQAAMLLADSNVVWWFRRNAPEILQALDDKEKVSGSTSDGYHTFDELYDHRITLFITLCRWVQQFGTADVWRSRKHSDDSSFDGWFVLGIFSRKGLQITYHISDARWQECDFATTLNRAPEFDGHTAADVLERLKRL